MLRDFIFGRPTSEPIVPPIEVPPIDLSDDPSIVRAHEAQRELDEIRRALFQLEIRLVVGRPREEQDHHDPPA